LAIDPIQKNEFDNNHFLLKFYTIWFFNILQ
jgi:hypothetical protein